MLLPDIRQTSGHDCGAACAHAICSYFDPLFHAGSLDSLNVNSVDGCDPRTLERFFRNRGFKVVSGEMTIDDLRYHSDRSRPVIVPLAGHYVVVCQALPRTIHVHDPLTGPRKLPAKSFVKSWQDHDRIEAFVNWGIAVYRG